MYLIANIIVCACALVGFVCGGTQFFRPKKALYAQMITLSLGCIAFGRLFNIIRLLTDGTITDSFQLGFLGIIGSLMFFFSSNFGTVDTLVDDRSKEFKKYRLIALAAPVAAIALYAGLFLFGEVSPLWKLQGAALTVFVIPASYFNLKHLIFPDVDFGVVKCLRKYNFLALVYMVSVFVECYAMSRDYELLTLICCCVTGLITAYIMPTIIRGIKKWTT